MRKFFIMLALVMGAFTVTACSKVPAGNVGIVVNLMGGDKGVDIEERGPGWYWIGWNQELHLFPTFTQNASWTLASEDGSNANQNIPFQTREGLSVNADIGLSYSIEAGKAADIFRRYRRGVEEVTALAVRNSVRDALVVEGSRLSVDSVYGEGKTELITAVENRVRDQFAPLGIVIERVYWIGDIRLPETVIERLNSKIAMQQEAEAKLNEVAREEAQAKINVARAQGEADSIRVRAEAEAEANRIISNSLTPELVRYRMIEKWDGIQPKITGSVTPMVQMPPLD